MEGEGGGGGGGGEKKEEEGRWSKGSSAGPLKRTPGLGFDSPSLKAVTRDHLGLSVRTAQERSGLIPLPSLTRSVKFEDYRVKPSLEVPLALLFLLEETKGSADA